jgi:signal peptidase I
MEAVLRGSAYPWQRWIARSSVWGRVAASALVPGLSPALAGRAAALAWALAGAAALVGGAAASAGPWGCTCGLVAGAALYAVLGVASGLSSRARRSSGLFRAALTAMVLAAPPCSVAAVRGAILDFFHVGTASMAPTIEPGDLILVSRLSTELRRGDLAVFRGDGGRLYVKRVVALPGDRVALDHGELLVDGARAPLRHAAAEERGARYYTQSGERPHWVLLSAPWGLRPSLPERVVPRGHVFVLGDNRDRSLDSRRLGAVPLSEVVGRPFALGPSHGGDGTWRWGRLGTLL